MKRIINLITGFMMLAFSGFANASIGFAQALIKWDFSALSVVDIFMGIINLGIGIVGTILIYKANTNNYD